MLFIIFGYIIGLRACLNGNQQTVTSYWLGLVPLLVALVESVITLRVLKRCDLKLNSVEECKKNSNNVKKYDTIVLMVGVFFVTPLLVNFTCPSITYIVNNGLYRLLQDSHQTYAIYYTVVFLLTIVVLLGTYAWHGHLMKKHIQGLK